MKPVNSIVCIKPIPDQRFWDKIRLDPKTKTLRRAGIPIALGPVDKNALEEALRIREARGGKVTAISMGPPGTEEILEWAIVLGADEAVLLSDRAFAGADTLATAYALASGIKKLGGADLIFLGNESLDGSTGQVGPQVAEFLGLPHITHVSKIDLTDEDTLRARFHIEFGFIDIEVKTPVVLAVEKEINEPRIPNIWGAVWIQERKINCWSADDVGVDKTRIGLSGSPTQVSDVTTLELKRKGEMLSGEPSDVAKQLVRKLQIDKVLPEA
jgi:Electron transfer flavoprotein, beta subunit